jgi:hypothetical protein
MQNLQRESKTPYGNQRKIILAAKARAAGLNLCSTPYGNQRKIMKVGIAVQPAL